MKKTVQENRGVSAQAPGLATSARERHAHGRLRRWHLYWLTTLRGTGDGTPAHWSPTVQYLHGRDLSGTVDGAGGIGGLLARSHGYSSGSWAYHNFYHSDGNGNVTALVNTGGTLQASYIYDPYGRYLSGTGTLLMSNVMRFSSKPWIGFQGAATSGLYYYGYRFYDPYLQRWLNRDPISERAGQNVYAFVHNRPTSLRDPFGESVSCPCSQSDALGTASVLAARHIEKTLDTGLEYGGYVCCDMCSGETYAGTTVSGEISTFEGKKQQTLPMSRSKCRPGDKVIALWHTHPRGAATQVGSLGAVSPDLSFLRGLEQTEMACSGILSYMMNEYRRMTILDVAGEETHDD